MHSDIYIIPTISIHPTKINIYNQVFRDSPRHVRNFDREFYLEPQSEVANFKDSTRTANGMVSQAAKKKISTALDYLVYISKKGQVQSTSKAKSVRFILTFITLTLPSKQIHTDNEIKNKCLNSFILEIKEKYKVRNYLWRAEKQKNGNIHFHIITDKFIPWNELRQNWNRIVEKLGYVSKYREELKEWHKSGFKVRQDLLAHWSLKDQVRAYEKGRANDYNNPNSTDIHSIRKIKNIKAYVCKYMLKNIPAEELQSEEDKNQLLVKGRIWSCNQELSNIKGAQIEIDSELEKELKVLKSGKHVKKFESEYASVIYCNIDTLQEFGYHALFRYFAEYFSEHFKIPLQFSI